MNKGRITTTRPLPLEVVQKIKVLLKDRPRESAWFHLSVNSAFRGGDILNIEMNHIRPLPGGWLEITIRERKTRRLRVVNVNPEVAYQVNRWLTMHPMRTSYLFEGSKGTKMGTSWWGIMLRGWCAEVGFVERNVSTHSCRKTFVKENYARGAKLVTLMSALNHSSEAQTLKYCGVMDEDIQKLYERGI